MIKSNKVSSKEDDATRSSKSNKQLALELPDVDESSNLTFCGSILSPYDTVVRWLYCLACFLIILTSVFHCYVYFYDGLQWYLITCVRLSDFIYLFVIILRMRTAYLTNGIREVSLNKIREKYESLFSLSNFLTHLTSQLNNL